MEEIARHANRPTVAIVGAGNVATHLATALAKSADVVQIVSRHDDTARQLAEHIGPRCSHSGNIDDLTAEADFYIIAAHDDAIAEIAESTPDHPGIWAHTSGSVSAEVFSGKKSRFGVFYPLQTFSRELEVDVRKIPFFIEGNSDESALALRALALRIADNVMNADSERRRLLIMGSSTWGDGELEDDWYDFIAGVEVLDLKGKKVALFGCGDESMTDTFCNAVGELHDRLEPTGCIFIAPYDTIGYTFEKSKAKPGDALEAYGLLLDEVNHPELTAPRLAGWTTIVRESAS